MKKLLSKFLSLFEVDVPVAKEEAPAKKRMTKALSKAKEKREADVKTKSFPIQPPVLAPGVVPVGEKAPVMATDNAAYTYASQAYQGQGFPGYPYLSQLALRPEFRAFASSLSVEMTREWIELSSTDSAGADTGMKIKEINEEMDRLGLRSAVQAAIEHDCLFGRGQLYLELEGQNRELPLLLSPRTIKKNSFKRIVPVEAVWTTPSSYDALDPASPDFYRPTRWFMMGNQVHADRLLTVITRPVPDMLKPAFNFGGISMSQLAEPYVENWLRTRQSVSDLINNFSITILKTAMAAVLQGDDEASSDLFDRADLFNMTRSNRGLMLLDKDQEEIDQVNTPLSGLHELQAQSQEHMCSVSRTPAVILTGISPSGLNASSDGEITAWYDWVAAQQEAHWRGPVDVVLQLIQLSKYGVVDPNIVFKFKPLQRADKVQESTIRKSDADTAVAYINAGVLDPSEVREKLADDKESGYQNIDLGLEIVPPAQQETALGLGSPDEPPDPGAAPEGGPDFPEGSPPPPKGQAQDEFKEGDHPRADNGQFGSGSSSTPKATKKSSMIKAEGDLPDHIKSLNHPPAWTDVHYSTDPKANLLVMGRDAKGRPQCIYSDEWKASQSAKKFNTVRKMTTEMDDMKTKIEADQYSKDQKTKEHAQCMLLVSAMGVRPGSDTDTKAEKKAYGATNMEARHVIVDKGQVRLEFTGKKGVELSLPVTDKSVALMLMQKKKMAKSDTERVFSGVTDKTLLGYVKELSPTGYKTKDFRTYVGTSKANDLIKGVEAPTTEKEYKQIVKEIATKVSEVLGNTPIVALQSYIDPSIFAPLRSKL